MGPPSADGARFPYRHLNEAELELAEMNGEIQELSPEDGGASRSAGAGCTPSPRPRVGLLTLVLASMVAAGVQFGWALQLSLLTPYVQTLGIGHAFSSFIWLCGPITGLIAQPCVGVWSDQCQSKYGKRRPFILSGALMISFAVILIGFSADIGYIFGDTKENCRTYKGSRLGATIVFVIGFWLLDLANNTVQGPARALLADLSGSDQMNSANAIFCTWMSIGNILGFLSGSNGNWHRWFPFLISRACCEACANLKAAFLLAVVFLLFCTFVTLYFIDEVALVGNPAQCLSDAAPLLKEQHQNGNYPLYTRLEKLERGHDYATDGIISSNEVKYPSDFHTKEDEVEAFKNKPGTVLVNILTGLGNLPQGMIPVLTVTALTWISWFPFFLFDTDWMGREVYYGNPTGSTHEMEAYQNGVREGAFGLLLNSVVLGISSLLIQPMCQMIGAKFVWAISNFILFLCMTATVIISLLSFNEIQHVVGANRTAKITALVIFSLLGFPLAITYSVPNSVTAELTAGTGGGQGLATGVLNLAIVIPQIFISLCAGPWDALFGGGNGPAFSLAAAAALIAGIIAVRYLPNLSGTFGSTAFHFG